VTSEGQSGEVFVSASVITRVPEHALKAAEVLGRAAAGLLLDGISVSVNMHTIEEEDGSD
jgi:hypothetical protein